MIHLEGVIGCEVSLNHVIKKVLKIDCVVQGGFKLPKINHLGGIMMNTVRVGVMPGKINEFAVEEGTSIRELLDIAGLDASGYDVKVDGAKIEDLDGTTVTSQTNLVLLVKKVKGNAGGFVRIGAMPGKIEEYAIEVGTSINDALAQAGLDPTGYDVKVDGVKVDPNSATVQSDTNLILLVKQVKGN